MPTMPNAYGSINSKILSITRPNAFGSINVNLTPYVTEYNTEILFDNPVGYWPLSDSVGTTALVNRASNPALSGGTASLIGTTLLRSKIYENPPKNVYNYLSNIVGGVALSSSNWFMPATNGWSIEFWSFIPETSGFGESMIFNFTNIYNADPSSVASSMSLRFTNHGDTGNSLKNGLIFRITNAATLDMDTLELPAPTAEWHHWVFTQNKDTGMVNVYRDSNLVGKRVMPVLVNAARQYKRFGMAAGNSSPSNAANAHTPMGMSNIAVYHSELSAARVEAHYLASGAKKRPLGYIQQVRQDSPLFAASLRETSGSVFETFGQVSTNGWYIRQGSLASYAAEGPSSIQYSKSVEFPSTSAPSMLRLDSPAMLGSFTFEAWIKLPSLPASGQTNIFVSGENDSGDPFNNKAFSVQPSGKLQMLYRTVNSSYSQAESTSTIPLNTWTHVAVTVKRSLGLVKFYINGNLDATITLPMPYMASNNFYIHGSMRQKYPSPMNIAYPAVYATELTPERILAHYASSTEYTLASSVVEDLRAFPTDTGAQLNWVSPGPISSYEYQLDNVTVKAFTTASLTTANKYLDFFTRETFSNTEHSIRIRAINDEYGTSTDWSDPAVFVNDLESSQHRVIFTNGASFYLPMQEANISEPFREFVSDEPIPITSVIANAPVRDSESTATRVATQTVGTSNNNEIVSRLNNSKNRLNIYTEFEASIWVNFSNVPDGNFTGCLFAISSSTSNINGIKLNIGSSTNWSNNGRTLHVNGVPTGWTVPLVNANNSKSIYNFVVSKYGNTVDIYVDNALIYRNTSFTSNLVQPNVVTNRLTIGANFNPTSQPLDSRVRVESFAFFPRKLSSPERKAISVSGGRLDTSDVYNPSKTVALQVKEGIYYSITHPYVTTGDVLVDGVQPQLAYSDVIKDAHPELYYRLDETSGTVATDSSENNKSGTYIGTYSLSQPSALTGVYDLGKSIYCTSGGVMLSNADYPITELSKMFISAEAWIKPDSITDGTKFITGKYNGNNAASAAEWSWVLKQVGDKLEATIQPATGSPMVLLSNAGAIKVNEWQHVAFTYSTDWLKLYVNGVMLLDAQFTSTLNVSAGVNAPFYIGMNQKASENFKGQIDEVAVYSYALSGREITKHYVAGMNRYSYKQIIRLPDTNVHSLFVDAGNQYTASRITVIDNAEVTKTSTGIYYTFDQFDRAPSRGLGHPEYGPSKYYEESPNTYSSIISQGLVASPVTNGPSAGTAHPGTATGVRKIPANSKVSAVLSAHNSNWVGVYSRMEFISATNWMGVSANIYNGGSTNTRLTIHRGTTVDEPVITNLYLLLPQTLNLYSYNDYVSLGRTYPGSVEMIGGQVPDQFTDYKNPSKTFCAGMRWIYSGNANQISEFKITSQDKPPAPNDILAETAFLYKGRKTKTEDKNNTP